MCEWIHICNDIDSGQEVEKTIKAFLWFSKKNNLLCMMGTHVMTLIMNKM